MRHFGVTQTSPYPPRVSLARLPTPLQRLDNLSAAVGGPTIWVKRDDLTEGPAGGNKLRKLEFSIGQAVADGADVLITAGAKQSNHCRQTAFAAARLGLGCHLLLAGRPSRSAADGNLLLDELMGAEISYLSPDEFDQLPQQFEMVGNHYRAQGLTPCCIPTGASDATGLWGYIDCARELAEDFRHHEISPRAVIAATASAGTQAGLMIGAERYGLDTAIEGVAVIHDEATIRAKIDELIGHWRQRYDEPMNLGQASATVVDRYVAPGYGKASPGVYRTIRRVAALEGLIFDPVYTGKAFHGLLQEIEAGRFASGEDIVFVHTGGIYGVFPHRQSLARPSSAVDDAQVVGNGL